MPSWLDIDNEYFNTQGFAGDAEEEDGVDFDDEDLDEDLDEDDLDEDEQDLLAGRDPGQEDDIDEDEYDESLEVEPDDEALGRAGADD